MDQVDCREDFHKDIYKGAIELFISFPFRVTNIRPLLDLPLICWLGICLLLLLSVLHPDF